MYPTKHKSYKDRTPPKKRCGNCKYITSADTYEWCCRHPHLKNTSPTVYKSFVDYYFGICTLHTYWI